MTKLKPRWRNKIIDALSAVDEKLNTSREEPKETTIQELEEKMEKDTFSDTKIGINISPKFVNPIKKTHKKLRY